MYIRVFVLFGDSNRCHALAAAIQDADERSWCSVKPELEGTDAAVRHTARSAVMPGSVEEIQITWAVCSRSAVTVQGVQSCQAQLKRYR